ncbi:MAG: hypothetical protein H0T79_16645 [Deltaproteobacteria bacterium]|nr:hypothetical protein [Deltaproteobacteria bacterium]
MSRRVLVAAALTPLVAFQPLVAAAEGFGQCRVVDVQFATAPFTPPVGIPDLPPQIVIWIEKPAAFPSVVGEFVDTVFITDQTGRYGIGNRPGRMDFNSGPLWPYGRREGTFPIWANRQPKSYPRVIFQGDDENQLSHPPSRSSQEYHFCRPLLSSGTDKESWDAGTCASTSYTDKGKLSPTLTSLYPPRQDLTRYQEDVVDIDMYPVMNELDAVSQATPPPGMNNVVSWPIPPELGSGEYVIWVEVSKEFDHNATYSEAARPSPTVPYGQYGEAYRGQPSVVYKVPFALGDGEHPVLTLEYAGYSDPDGLDGNLRAPDGTITTDVLGSGASRLAMQIDDLLGAYRVRVDARTEQDGLLPSAPGELSVVATESGISTISFVAPGDDGMSGTARRYEFRYRVGAEITEADFDTASVLDLAELVIPDEAGQVQLVPMKTLLPETDYSIAIRAVDNCNNVGPIAALRFTTPARVTGEVDACFIATAAYGSVMAQDVGFLRRFRDSVMRGSVIGELVVESYYTFGPAVAGVIGESDLLRATARELLTPIISWVRIFRL